MFSSKLLWSLARFLADNGLLQVIQCGIGKCEPKRRISVELQELNCLTALRGETRIRNLISSTEPQRHRSSSKQPHHGSVLLLVGSQSACRYASKSAYNEHLTEKSKRAHSCADELIVRNPVALFDVSK